MMRPRHLIASFLFTVAGILLMSGVQHQVMQFHIAAFMLIIGGYGLHEGV